MRKVSILCLVLAAGPAAVGAAHAQTRDISVHGELLDRIAAIVNDGLVLKSELDEQMDVGHQAAAGTESRAALAERAEAASAGSAGVAGNSIAARQARRPDDDR